MKKIIPGVDGPLNVSEITEYFGPAVQKKYEQYKEFICKGGKLDGWAKYEKESEKKRWQK